MVKDKKGIELSLQAIVVFIILIIVMLLVVIFFVKHYGANSDGVINISKDVIGGIPLD